MKKHLLTSVLYTLVTALILGIAYPLMITAVAKVFFSDKASGQIIRVDGEMVGSHLIGQPFTGPGYFHSRPSAAGAGYDASSSSGSNLGPSSKALIDRINAVPQVSTAPIPIDLITSSGSGLDPDITPAAALYQAPRIAYERNISEAAVDSLIAKHKTSRQFGFLGESRINVLELNLELNLVAPLP